MVDGRKDEGRQLDGYSISSLCEPNGSGELTIWPHIGGRFNMLAKNKHFSSLQIFRGKILEDTEVE